VTLELGQPAPDFRLPDTAGEEHGPGGAATALVFTCNHCPYAIAWHGRILEAARDYAERDVRFLLVNPNDAERYPRDSLDAMTRRVEADGGWPAPYLRDDSQEVAAAYGALTTPHVFVLDGERRLRYHGAPDADHGDPAQGAGWLRSALDAVLGDRDPEPAETDPIGCSVKWKPGR
jgi:hypothetical protein